MRILTGVTEYTRADDPVPDTEDWKPMATKKKKKRGRPRSAKKSRSATFRLPEELLEKLAEQADTEERSQTTLVRRALEAFLAEDAEQESGA